MCLSHLKVPPPAGTVGTYILHLWAPMIINVDAFFALEEENGGFEGGLREENEAMDIGWEG